MTFTDDLLERFSWEGKKEKRFDLFQSEPFESPTKMGVVVFGTSRGIMGREEGLHDAGSTAKSKIPAPVFNPTLGRRFQLAERDRRRAWALRLARLFNFRRGERRRSSRAWKLLRVYFGINATKPAFNLSLCGSSNTAAPAHTVQYTHIYMYVYLDIWRYIYSMSRYVHICIYCMYRAGCNTALQWGIACD